MRLLSILLLVLAGCEGPVGPEGPQGPAGPAGEVSEVIVTIFDKNYTTINPNFATIVLDDNAVDYDTVVLSVMVENANGVWQTLEVVGPNVIYSGILFVSGENSYDGLTGYAVMIFDAGGQLLNRMVRIQYIPRS